MISPVNSDKPISTTTEQSGRSNRGNETDQTTVSTTTQESRTSIADSSTLEVDNARQLFNIETNRANAANAVISTPEQARSLLENILQQFASSPESAAKSQAAKVSTTLSSLLESAPA
ncbi:MAG: hypothetical protein KZQ92_07795 [Candidatus Thiodiazotropha sp. (ex Lucinoma borealis)]|nr:hypothetical protein [Candidatus Thiodiazotropha sp. (ex Lucinoma borealis)]MCU7946059.1 hypothetical protein [Candidatus Thiodiazotropha sp. (ex Cardiolucina cf. quadrata)]MCU7857529.1 hypothetical protein [Candidatus Thiodiazotropha sp. (ex Lucinoma borealis)]MCU7863864.1 hypothetical protein [Candidatus Thiodiazotropha sp. (ex Lucinoma borealis)]MCU7870485.1 hypothetical protein [Candidatus Thiodiazotropha sp. (ex Lucinoma borealis)]